MQRDVFKMGFLSMIAATGLFVAANGFAADAHTTSTGEGVKAKVVSDDVKIPETPAPRWHNAGTLRQVNETTRIGGNCSDNEIRADEITIPLLAPCVAVVADLFHLIQEGVRWKRIPIV